MAPVVPVVTATELGVTPLVVVATLLLRRGQSRLSRAQDQRAPKVLSMVEPPGNFQLLSGARSHDGPRFVRIRMASRCPEKLTLTRS